MVRLFASITSKRIAAICAAVAVIGVAGTTLALGASHQTKINPDTSVTYTDNTTLPVVTGIQNGNGIGVEGVVGNTNGAIGMLGFQDVTTTNGIGMEGLVWGKSSTGLYGQGLKNTDAAHPSVGLLGTSTSGVGVEGQSLIANGVAVEGISDDAPGSSGQLGVNGGAGVFGTTARNNSLMPGVEGESTVNGSDAAGGFGLTSTPTMGLVSQGTLFAIQSNILGDGTNGPISGIGVFGQELSTSGSGATDGNLALFGDGRNGEAVVGTAGGDSEDFGAPGFPIAGLFVGHQGLGAIGYGEIIEAFDASTTSLYMQNTADGRTMNFLVGDGSDDIIRAHNTSGTSVFKVDNSGNETLAGHITTSGGTLVEPRTNNGLTVQEYGSRSTVPDIEDFGEARLASGTGYVHIDAALSNAIDRSAAYLVFITPEGDSNGLYVVNKTGAGFSVRENAGGRHSLTFSYRIVAKPVDESGTRLSVVHSLAIRDNVDTVRRHRTMFPSTDPYQMLVSRVGEAKARQMFAQFEASAKARALMTNRLPHADANGNLHVSGATIRTTPQ